MKDFIKNALELAVDNIIKFGDTDVFPYPIENRIFYDSKPEILKLLHDMYNKFDDHIQDTPPLFENMLAAAGYNGFRWVTQIDPIWNAFFLGMVLSIANKIEGTRITKEKNYVFSYRIKLDDNQKSLFDENYGWRKFEEESLALAKEEKYKYVLLCDISNFYQSVYHHRVENALDKIGNQNKEIEKHIMAILQRSSNIKSYGLPVGGQASRILAELLLNRTDKLLFAKEIRFCRFVDDYHLFATSEDEAYSQLLFLSKILIENEGFALQKSKTRIVSFEEFIQNSPVNEKQNPPKNNIFAISLKYDPYSQTAEEDYEKLKKEIQELDILTMLSQELHKTRIHTSLLKKIINSLKYLEEDQLNAAIESLIENIDILAPVFPNLMILIESVFEKLSDVVQEKIHEKLRALISGASYIMKIDLNISYAIRVLSKKYNEDNEIVLTRLYDTVNNSLIKKDIILIMAQWNATHWISNLKNNYANLTIWEKRSFIIASYKLGDEGRNWRDHFKKEFSDIDRMYRDWMSAKVQSQGWELTI